MYHVREHVYLVTMTDRAVRPSHLFLYVFFFFFNDTATTEIYTLSLHDALPISGTTGPTTRGSGPNGAPMCFCSPAPSPTPDRKSTRLNSSHSQISYAVFCLKKKKKKII